MDLLLGSGTSQDATHPSSTTDWLATHQTRLHDAYARAGEHLEYHAQKRRGAAGMKVNHTPISTGQRVYLQSRGPGRRKIQDNWDSRVYKVVEVPTTAGDPYTVELTDGGGAISKIQRTEMRPCPTMSQTVPLGKNNSCHSSEGLPATSEGLSDTQSSSSLSSEEEEEEFLTIAGPHPPSPVPVISHFKSY